MVKIETTCFAHILQIVCPEQTPSSNAVFLPAEPRLSLGILPNLTLEAAHPSTGRGMTCETHLLSLAKGPLGSKFPLFWDKVPGEGRLSLEGLLAESQFGHHNMFSIAVTKH